MKNAFCSSRVVAECPLGERPQNWRAVSRGPCPHPRRRRCRSRPGPSGGRRRNRRSRSPRRSWPGPTPWRSTCRAHSRRCGRRAGTVSWARRPGARRPARGSGCDHLEPVPGDLPEELDRRGLLLAPRQLQPQRIDPAAQEVDRLAILGVAARLHRDVDQRLVVVVDPEPDGVLRPDDELVLAVSGASTEPCQLTRNSCENWRKRPRGPAAQGSGTYATWPAPSRRSARGIGLSGPKWKRTSGSSRLKPSFDGAAFRRRRPPRE